VIRGTQVRPATRLNSHRTPDLSLHAVPRPSLCSALRSFLRSMPCPCRHLELGPHPVACLFPQPMGPNPQPTVRARPHAMLRLRQHPHVGVRRV
jgi:hypothetical protein